jgi:anti-sigma factor RsiW
MNDTVYESLAAIARRRELTAAEASQVQAWLAAHPEARPGWEQDQRLSRLLRALPDAPLASNFTARVLQQVAKTQSPAPRGIGFSWLRLLWPMRHAWRAGAVALAGLVLFGVEYRRTATRAELRGALAKMPVAGLADVELWRDFDSIRNLPEGALPSISELAEALK